MRYLRYDSKRGPIRSRRQPRESEMEPCGTVRVGRGNGKVTVYNIFRDRQNEWWASKQEKTDG